MTRARQAEPADTTTLTVLAGAVIIALLPILNGGPFIYFDTPAYIEQTAKAVGVLLPQAEMAEPAVRDTAQGAQGARNFGQPQEDRIVFGGRSIYYGALAYAGWMTSLWLPVIVQVLTLSWLVVTLFRHLAMPGWRYHAMASLLAMALLSSASFFAGFVMPDIWAGFLILSLAILWTFGRALGRRARLTLLAILSYAALVHTSHIALLAALIGLFVLARLIPAVRRGTALRQLAIPVLALGIGMLGEIAYSTAVRTFYGADLVQRPFITAHLVDMGPGTRLAQETCPDSGWALCPFADRLPVDWITFLFDTDPDTGVFAVATPEVQRAIIDEQSDFARRALAVEPGATLAGLAADGLSQLWTLTLDDVALSHENRRYISANMPADLIAQLQGTHIYHSPQLADALLWITRISGAISAAVLLVWALRHDPARPGAGMVGRLVLILVAGVVLNALICGILASPYGRFQARIIWILPLIAGLVISTATSGRRATPQPSGV